MISTLLLISLLCCCAAEILLSCGEVDKTVYVEGVDFLYCSCNGPGNNRTTFQWSLTNATGLWKQLAICYGIGNCTTYFPSDMTAIMYPTSSDLSFTNLTSQYAGNLTCTQSNSTFQGSSSFTIKLKRVSINNCQGDITIQEGRNVGEVFCEMSPYGPRTVTWTIATRSGQPLDVGICSSSKNFKFNCTSPLSPNITLTSDKTSSRLSFGNNYINRDMTAAICSVSFSDYTEADNCSLDVYNPATVENCTLEKNTLNWSLSFSCDVAQVFSSKEDYDFTVIETFYLLKNEQLIFAESNLFKDFLSYRQYLASYTNSTDKRKYYRGRVVYTWSMLPYPGTFQSFAFQTSNYDRSQLDIPNGFNISLPTRPRHNCSDVKTPCSCSTVTLGLPAGRLLWLIGNTTIAVGDYGVKDLSLPLDNLPSGKDVMVARCKLDWIQFLMARNPIVLGKPYISEAGNSRLLAIVSWTMLGAFILFDVVFVVILVRFGRLPKFLRKRSPQQPEDNVGLHGYDHLKTPPAGRCSNKGDEVPETTDAAETASP